MIDLPTIQWQSSRSLIEDDERFRFYENDKNYGCGYTKRRCAELAMGEVCAFVDPDDTITTDALEKMVEAHNQNPSVAMVYSTFVYCNEKLEPVEQYENAMQVKVDEYFINENANVCPFAAFKKVNYDKTVGIEPTLPLAVDQDLYLKLAETGSFYFLNEVLYQYRIHKNGISTSNRMKAFYYQIKVILDAEKRRGITLEKNIEAFLLRVALLANDKKLENPGYAWLKLLNALKKDPGYIVRKLLRRK